MIRNTLLALALVVGCVVARPTHAQTPKPTATPTQTQQLTTKAYATFLFVKATQVMLEETATARRDEKIDGLKTLGAVLVIATTISGTRGLLARPAPLPDFKPQWAELTAVNTAMTDMLKRWAFDKTIDSAQVLRELPPLAKRIDAAGAKMRNTIVRKYKGDPKELQTYYDGVLAKMRETLKSDW